MGLGVGDVPTGCAWTRNGAAFPCVAADPGAGAKIGAEFAAHEPLVLTPLYEASRNANPQLTSAATFPLQAIHGPVLCLAAGDDRMWPSSEHCGLTMQYLRDHHHAFADEEHVYPRAGHLFVVAARGPQSAINSVQIGAATMAFGGTPDADASAAAQAWPQIWGFLARALGT